MSYTSQNLRLFHVSNLSVRNFRTSLLMCPGCVSRGWRLALAAIQTGCDCELLAAWGVVVGAGGGGVMTNGAGRPVCTRSGTTARSRPLVRGPWFMIGCPSFMVPAHRLFVVCCNDVLKKNCVKMYWNRTVTTLGLRVSSNDFFSTLWLVYSGKLFVLLL